MVEIATNEEMQQQELSDLNLDLNKNLKTFVSFVDGLMSNFRNDPQLFDSNKGISFLSMKNMLMIEYLTNLLNLVLLKMNGKKIAGSSCVQRLAELRCIIEKTKSIEFKLKYQIDKLLKMAVSLTSDEQDPLSFKANVGNFANGNENEDDDDDIITKGDEDDEDDQDALTKKSNELRLSGKYVPPKINPVYNDIDQTPEDKMKKEIERQKRRALNSTIIKELESEYSGAPEEIRDIFSNTLESETRDDKHRKEYEEENFVRKPLTKKEMERAKRLRRGTNLNSLASFDDARLLLDENINMEEYLKAKKSKKTGKKDKKGKKKGSKKNKKKIRYT